MQWHMSDAHAFADCPSILSFSPCLSDSLSLTGWQATMEQ